MQYLYERMDGERVNLSERQMLTLREQHGKRIVEERLAKNVILFRMKGVRRGKAPRPLKYGGQTETARLAALQHLSRDGILALAHGAKVRRVA